MFLDNPYKYLMSIDESVYDNNFSEQKVTDVAKDYKYIHYGFIFSELDNDKLEDTENLWEKGFHINGVKRDQKSLIKHGQIETDSLRYYGKTVQEAITMRIKEQYDNSKPNWVIPVYTFPNNKSDKIFHSFVNNECNKGDNGEFTEEIKKIKEKTGSTELITATKSSIRSFLVAFNLKNSGAPESTWRAAISNKHNRNFKLSKRQIRMQNKFVRYFSEPSDKERVFLFAAKPRFGKNFTLLECFKEVKWKTVLFMSYLPSVLRSLEDDIVDHVDFKKINYINYRENRNINLKNDADCNIISTSIQLMNYADTDESSEEMSLEEANAFRASLMALKEIPIDAVVIDEAHFGGKTLYIRNIIRELGIKNIIYVTGTASKYLSDDCFNSDNTFQYDYIDECENVEGDAVASIMPTIKTITYEMNSQLKDNLIKNGIWNNGFSYRSFFETDKNCRFVHEYEVIEFFKWIFGAFNCDDLSEGADIINDINKISPFNSRYNGLEEAIKHAVMTFPTIDSVNAFEHLVKYNKDLKRIAIGKGLIFKNAAGNNIKDINVIKEAIVSANKSCETVITLICKRFREGVTVPEWNALFMFDDINSCDEYIQTMFRIQNYGENKHYCYVFDYNLERCLTMRYNYIYHNTKKGRSKTEYQEVVDKCMPIMEYDKFGKIVEAHNVIKKMFDLTREKFKKEGFNAFTDPRMFCIHSSIDIDTMDRMRSIFRNVSIRHRNSDIVNVEVSTNGGVLKNNSIVYKHIEAVVNKINSFENGECPKSSVEKEIERFHNLCSECMRGLPKFVYLSDITDNTIMLSNIFKKCDDELFEACTGITVNDFKFLINIGYINDDFVTSCIQNFIDANNDLKNINDYIISDTDACFEEFDKFNSKWIYEKNSTDIDVQYCVLNKYF